MFISSKGDDLGLEYWPANLPILTTGKADPKVRTTAICNNTLKLSLILLALCSANDSAQSPPCNKKALPSATSAILFLNLLASSAKTKGGLIDNSFSTLFTLARSLYSGTCLIGSFLQLSIFQSIMTFPLKTKSI